MLKEIQMPPGFLDRIMGLQAVLVAHRAVEGAAFGKIKADIQTLLLGVKLRRRHLPWRCQTKGQLE